MEQAAYQSLRDTQDEHWWFVGRRRIVARLIERLVPLPSNARLLEAGCGCGGNLAMLSGFGRVDAFEFDEAARAHAAAISPGRVSYGKLPEEIGFGAECFDLIALLDVLEHIDDDVGSLAALGNRLASGGSLVLTVPAMPWLWSKHDEVHHHKRRYTKALLAQRIRAAGLEIESIGYFNSLLFPLALAQRMVSRLTGRSNSHDTIPPEPLNAVLAFVFALERAIVGRIAFPLGLSLFAVIRKPAS